MPDARATTAIIHSKNLTQIHILHKPTNPTTPIQLANANPRIQPIAINPHPSFCLTNEQSKINHRDKQIKKQIGCRQVLPKQRERYHSKNRQWSTSTTVVFGDDYCWSFGELVWCLTVLFEFVFEVVGGRAAWESYCGVGGFVCEEGAKN